MTPTCGGPGTITVPGPHIRHSRNTRRDSQRLDVSAGEVRNF